MSELSVYCNAEIANRIRTVAGLFSEARMSGRSRTSLSSATLVHPCTSRDTSASMRVARHLHILCGNLGRWRSLVLASIPESGSLTTR